MFSSLFDAREKVFVGLRRASQPQHQLSVFCLTAAVEAIERATST
jgi:hypothetical protein